MKDPICYLCDNILTDDEIDYLGRICWICKDKE
jgi:hypothetical protein